jgi:outer membrane lipoprotein-sorting protein
MHRMKKLLAIVFLAILTSTSLFAQSQEAGLEQVLSFMDKVNANFKSVQTDFEWDQYQKVVDEHDVQRGVMYFKRNASGVDVAAVITSPLHKKLVFKNNELRVYFPKTGQLTKKKVGENRETVESFLALGFGGRGHELLQSFQVEYAGTESIGGAACYKLKLTPKGERARSMFPLITLWINQKTGMSEQQRLEQGEGDFRLARYTNIEVNPSKLPSGAFDVKNLKTK